MSKYIDRDKLVEFARHSTIGIDANDIMRFPTADVVEVVRCKDCKYWEYKCQGDCNLIYGDCLYWQTEHHSDYYMETTGEHYCGFAERKETDE